MIDDNKYILDLIKNGEGLNVDFKHSVNNSKKIARSLAAFANTEGGSLLLGVRDNGGIAGISSDEEYYMIETAALIFCKPPVEFTFKNWKISGKNVMEIIVAKSDIGPHYAPDATGEFKAYVRNSDQNLIANKILLEVWKRKKKDLAGIKIMFDDVVETLFKEIQENGSTTKSNFIRITGIKSTTADKLLANLVLMNIIDFELSEKSTKFVFNKEYFENNYLKK
jgi:predicted HTH transcriptional regulator